MPEESAQTPAQREELSQQSEPETGPEAAAPSQFPDCVPLEFAPYKIGDTVYLRDMEFSVRFIDGDYMELRTVLPNSGNPYYRTESRSKVEEELRLDERNARITDFLPANLRKANADLCEILTRRGGLFNASEKKIIEGYFREGRGNKWLEANLPASFAGVTNTLVLESGENADFLAASNGVEYNVHGKYATPLFASWHEIIPILRAMYQQERNGFSHEAAQSATEKAAPEILPGMELTLDGHRMRIDRIDAVADRVELLDLDSPRGMLPTFIVRNMESVRALIAEQSAEKTAPETAVVVQSVESSATLETAVGVQSAEPPAVPETPEASVDAQPAELSDAPQTPSLSLNAEAYLNLKARKPFQLVGVQDGDFIMFYGKDAEEAAPALGTRVFTRDIPG